MYSWWCPTAFHLLFAIGPARLAWALIRSRRARHSVREFVDAPAIAPTAYVAAMIESATADHAFAWRAAGVHLDVPTLHSTLLRSGDGETLATIIADARPTRGVEFTLLHSRFSDGTTLLTSDASRIPNLDRGTKIQLLLNADVTELCRLHAAGLAERGGVVGFPIDAGWDDLAAASASGIDRLVAARRVRVVGADRTAYRHTWRGAFLATVWFAVTSQFDTHPASRRYKRRPGADGPPATAIAVAAEPSRSG